MRNNKKKLSHHMAHWYDKYLTIYGTPFCAVPEEVKTTIRRQLADRQSDAPQVSVVVIAYNEESRLTACLWSLSELQSKYPLEIMGVNNNSKDQTEEVFRQLGVPYHNETRQSPGFARQCGLDNARGKYHFFIDADTFYPPRYVDLMMHKLERQDVACVGGFWSFFPDKQHGPVGLMLFEAVRDLFLWAQHFKRPELCIRGMVFAFRADYARQLRIRTDIRRGEDGSLALELKRFGRIAFLYHRQARPVTGYGTLGAQSLWQSFVEHVKIQGRGITRIFFRKDHYEDSEENLIHQQ